MIQHPFPERVLSTPLHQLPYIVSQINSQIHKTSHDMTKYLEENIQVCMEQHNKKIQLRKQIYDTNEQYKILENVGAQLQMAIANLKGQSIEQENQSQDNEEKLMNAIKNQNYDEMCKLFETIKDEVLLIKCSKIAANLLATPTKNQKNKIKQFLEIISSHPLISQQQKDEIIEICVKVCIQKCFKMYFQQNVWNTNKNQATYYSDIIQLYQKSFNCTFKLLSVFNLPNYHQAHIANNIFQKFNQNVLNHLVTHDNKEKSIAVILNFKNVQQNNLFYHLTNIYCKNQLIPILKQELQIKTLLLIIRNLYIKQDQQLLNIVNKKDTQQLLELCKQSKQINYNLNLFQALFDTEMQLQIDMLI
ncbi:unnamed protein product [Paramecium pentaurelia]|uniref:Uncharacterized protein n=1 Tax=Paramecium pentaurelia TaxID=43138 RepID=A0A8S1TXM7_9CILI|nr:unnamed protein product [Paramecium pentaurelia]